MGKRPVRRFSKGLISASEFQNRHIAEDGTERISKMFAIDKRYLAEKKDDGQEVWKSSNSYTISELRNLRMVIDGILASVVAPVRITEVTPAESEVADGDPAEIIED